MILNLLLFVSLSICTKYIGRQDNGIDAFIGIPYAQPPVGTLRLQPPLPIADNLGDLDVSKPTSNRCYELKTGAPSLSAGSEDCLTLDIIRPSQRNGVKLPVYVFIHGGNFNDGDKSDFDGRNMATASIQLGAPIIYVAINYRLSFLGFPTGKQLSGSYNLGLLDQRVALEWVQKEIQYFGGDPTKVVLGGHSGGANSVAYQMIAYKGQKLNGLFRGVVLESGSATALSAIQHTDNPSWQKSYDDIASAVGCNDASDTLLCLQDVPIDNLITAYTIEFAKSGLVSPISMFSPVPDYKFMDKPSSDMNSGSFAKVPSIIGTTTNELVERVPIYDGIGTTAAVTEAIQPNLPFVSPSALENLTSYYPVTAFQNIGPPLSGAQWSRAVAIENDIQMFCPVYTQAIQVSNEAPVWKFRWNAVLQSVSVPRWDGVPHISELYYLFPYNGTNMTTQSTADLTLMKSFQRYIIGFINNLNPNSLPALKNIPSVHWPQFDNKSQSRLVYERSDGSGKGVYTERETINQASYRFINSSDLFS